jgi:hypothetical protein
MPQRRDTLLRPALLAQLVEHFHGKEGVTGSSPVEGSCEDPASAGVFVVSGAMPPEYPRSTRSSATADAGDPDRRLAALLGDQARQACVAHEASRTCSGSATSAPSGHGRAGCISPRSKTPTRVGSSAGRWAITCAQSSPSTCCRWPSRGDGMTQADSSFRPGQPVRVVRVRPAGARRRDRRLDGLAR